MEPAAISFKGNVRAHTRVHTYARSVYRACVEKDDEWGKNRKPLYKLILGARRINTLPVCIAAAAAGLFLSLSASPVCSHIHIDCTLSSRTLSFALFWIDCLGGKAIFINANEQYEWVFRPAKAFTTNEIFCRRRHYGWSEESGCSRAHALNVCRLIANRTVARERDSINLIKLTLLVGLPIIPCNIHCPPSRGYLSTITAVLLPLTLHAETYTLIPCYRHLVCPMYSNCANDDYICPSEYL